MKRVLLVLISLLLIVQLSAQIRDSRVRDILLPTRILWVQDSASIDGFETLLTPNGAQANLNYYRMPIVMSSKGGAKPAILFDFGREIQGGLQIISGFVPSTVPNRVRVRFGESAAEAMCEITKENGATNDHALRDFEIDVPWCGSVQVGNSGFRFVRIDLLSEERDFKLNEVLALSEYRDIPYRGSFKSSDERLNRIWETGAYTVHLNMQEYLWDGIKRDRLIWAGDMHPEVMTIGTVFGYNEVVPKTLDAIRYVTPLPKVMNNISSYSIWWLLIQREWYMFTGDKEYLMSQQSYITELLKMFRGMVNENGVEKVKNDRFLDWPSKANPSAVSAGLQALMVMMMDAGEFFGEIYGDKDMIKECSAVKESLLSAAALVKNPFLASFKEADEPGVKQGVALMSLAGLMDATEANDRYLSYKDSHGFSTFYGYYMLEAMAKAGNYSGAIDIISEYWGAMLDLGATTFWEDFDIRWLENAARIDELVPNGKVDVHSAYGKYCYLGFRHSLCHGWASGPTSWLSRHVLGVEILEPGCKVVRITPHLGDLEWVEGKFPTPFGEIEISHRKSKSGGIISKIKAPKGIKIVK